MFLLINVNWVSQKTGMHPVKEPISAILGLPCIKNSLLHKHIGRFTILKMLTGWSEVIVPILEGG